MKRMSTLSCFFIVLYESEREKKRLSGERKNERKTELTATAGDREEKFNLECSKNCISH